jgi:hypothetical protein
MEFPEGNSLSGAEARNVFSTIYGTAEAVPFQIAEFFRKL